MITNKIDELYELIKKEMTITLATSFQGKVTMRVVSPVYYNENILFFTAPNSLKYKQIKNNPFCAFSIGGFFVEAKAMIMGQTMDDKNKELRDAYNNKFPNAFDEGIENGGRNSEFILLKPLKLSGWSFKDDVITSDGIPNIQFSIDIK